MSDSLQSQHARPPCPSPTPGVYPHSCPLSWWCHPTFSSSVVPFSSCPQSFPTSRSFQMSQLFASGGQSIGVSTSTSVYPMNTQNWSPLGWTGWISLQSKGLSRVLSNTTVQKHQFFCTYSQSYLFFSSHVQMWELDHKEGRTPKNWCFWTVLEKTLENPLHSKEIKSVTPKGNQPWIFIGRTDVEALILWSPDVKSWLTRKVPDAGKGWRQKEKRAIEDEIVGWHH